MRGIEEAIHLHDKLLLILSKDAVNSLWVQQEVEAALYKEVTTGREILFPICLDNTILKSASLWANACANVILVTLLAGKTKQLTNKL